MKLAIAIIFALVCSTIAEDAVKACADTDHWFDGTKCNACTSPCKSCVGKDNKESCLDCGSNAGKFLNSDGTCKDCIANCQACRGDKASDCYLPAADFKVSPSGLVKCPATLVGCLYCSAEGKCGKCAAGYRLDKEACTPCSSNTCVECKDDVAKCTKCAYWNTMKDGACTACDNGCKDCPCTGCKAGYAFKDAKCTRCTDAFNCAECAADAGKCTKCNTGTYLKDDKCTACGTGCAECTGADQCSKCSTGFALKDGKTCVQCPDKCETCNTDGKCSKCATNFWLNADKCTACGTGCDGCSATDGVCSKCLPGTFLDATDKKSCKPCGDSCKECADASKCKTCLDTAVIKDGVCKDVYTCAFGQAMKEDQTCVAGTINNCAKGNAVAGTCGYCAPGFYPKEKTCANCPAGCKECSNIAGYVKCSKFGQDGFSFTNDTNAKIDKTGYLGKDATYTLNFDNSDDKCMPNTWAATFTLNPFKHKCVAYDSCTMIAGQLPFQCFVEGNAVKMTLSLFAVVVATLFTL